MGRGKGDSGGGVGAPQGESGSNAAHQGNKSAVAGKTASRWGTGGAQSSDQCRIAVSVPVMVCKSVRALTLPAVVVVAAAVVVVVVVSAADVAVVGGVVAHTQWLLSWL